MSELHVIIDTSGRVIQSMSKCGRMRGQAPACCVQHNMHCCQEVRVINVAKYGWTRPVLQTSCGGEVKQVLLTIEPRSSLTAPLSAFARGISARGELLSCTVCSANAN